MRVGRIAVLLFTGMVVVGLGLTLDQPWVGLTRVDAIELDDDNDDARREDESSDGELEEDEPEPGSRGENGSNGNAAAPTDDGRDGTRDGDTDGDRGTGTSVGGPVGDVGTNSTATFDVGGGGGTSADGET